MINYIFYYYYYFTIHFPVILLIFIYSIMVYYSISQIHTNIWVYVHTHNNIHLIRVHVYMCCIYLCVHKYIQHIYTCIHIHMYSHSRTIHTHTRIYINTHTHTQIQAHTHAHLRRYWKIFEINNFSNFTNISFIHRADWYIYRLHFYPIQTHKYARIHKYTLVYKHSNILPHWLKYNYICVSLYLSLRIHYQTKLLFIHLLHNIFVVIKHHLISLVHYRSKRQSILKDKF